MPTPTVRTERPVPALPHYRVTADADTGAWLSEPTRDGDVARAVWDAMVDTDAEHFDTFEWGGETCAVTVTLER